jgi:hypothetical protein
LAAKKCFISAAYFQIIFIKSAILTAPYSAFTLLSQTTGRHNSVNAER